MAATAGKVVDAESQQKGNDEPKSTPRFLVISYILLNIAASCGIVFANKLVFSAYHFNFVITLSLIHTTFTWLGMYMLQHFGFFDSIKLSQMAVAPLAVGFVGYIVLGNLSLKLNEVGLYQILKIAIAPTVIVLEFLMFGKRQSSRILLAVAVVCTGVTAAVVTDKVAVSNVLGLVVGLLSVVITALYQIWAGSKQKELQANSSQLLLAYTPQAIALLALLAPGLDDVGLINPGPRTVLGYKYTPAAVAVITLSGVLGVLVSLSTFLVIGTAGSLTFNIMGHSKTVLILAGGCLVFKEAMPLGRLLGVIVTMLGIAWYTYLVATQAKPAGASGSSGAAEEGKGGGTAAGGLPPRDVVRNGTGASPSPAAPERRQSDGQQQHKPVNGTHEPGQAEREPLLRVVAEADGKA